MQIPLAYVLKADKNPYNTRAVFALNFLKKTVKTTICGILFCLVFTFQPYCSHAVSAKAFVLIEQNSGRILSASNENMRLPMASTTKIMTALLAVESGKLDETFTVPAEGLRVEGTSMGLVAGEKMTLRELVYGLMLNSGNDAANTIALILCGSIDEFVDMMNRRAAKLGLTNTNFCNPSGLYTENHYTSALDLARLAAYAMKNKDFAQIVGTKTIRVHYNGIANGRLLKNHNALLSSYDGAIGVKTGFVKKSGRCLVSCAKRNGVELVAVTLNDPNDWKDHKELLDSGFNQLTSRKLMSVSPTITANVVGGVSDKVETCYDKDVTGALKQGELERLKLKVELDRFYYAPIKKGQRLGKLIFTVDGVEVAETDITASANVAAQAKRKSIWDYFRNIVDSIISFFKIALRK